MDAGHVSKTRKFPAYTLAQLEAAVAEYGAGRRRPSGGDLHIAALKAEIAARKGGTSKAFIVPQL